MSKCYVVAIVGYEEHHIRYVCLSEGTARTKFEEVKAACIKDIDETYMHPDLDDEFRELSMQEGAKYIKKLSSVEYPGDKNVGLDRPNVEEFELLD